MVISAKSCAVRVTIGIGVVANEEGVGIITSQTMAAVCSLNVNQSPLPHWVVT